MNWLALILSTRFSQRDPNTRGVCLKTIQTAIYPLLTNSITPPALPTSLT